MTPWKVAVMLAEPADRAVIWPMLFTLTTVGLELVQVAVLVTSFVVLSERVAVATKLTLLPVVRFAPDVVQPRAPAPQVMAMELVTVLETVRVVLALRLPEATLMVEVPRFTAVANPVLLMVATVGEEDVQVAVLLMSLVVKSPNVPVAVNCCVLAVPEVLCSVIAGFAGEREIAARSCELMKNLPQLSAVARQRSAAIVTTILKRFAIAPSSTAAI